MDKVSMSHLISFSRYKHCYLVLMYKFDDVMNLKIFLGSTSKAMADREKKRERQKYKNWSISRMKIAI